MPEKPSYEELEQRIQELEQIANKLKESERKFASIFQSVPVAISLASIPHGKTYDVNQAWLDITGFSSKDEVLGKTSLELGLVYDAEARARILSQFQQHGSVRNGEMVLHTRSGLQRTLHVHLDKIEIDGRAYILSVNEDITAHKSMEAQLRQAQKMESIGKLAAGVAHDFNNLLTVIALASDFLLEEQPPDSPMYDMIEQIKQAGGQAASLTSQLLAFSRQQVLEPKVLDLNAIVSHSQKMLRHLLREDIAFVVSLEPGLGRIKADPTQIEQVLMNLIINARDAMPQGGTLTIETNNVELDASYAETHLEVEPGRYVMLLVCDTGCGMDPATQARIFEPFFTTKAEQGTGLGLATVFGIVKQSGGSIWVYSEAGHGTVFKIYLPLIEDAVSAGAAPIRVPVLTGSETVLLVEDQDAVRKMAVLALKMFGYTVIEASHGPRAIELCRQYPGEIQLLISDVFMPEMGGREVADAIRTLRPDIRVLYMSGYTDDAVMRNGMVDGQVTLLQKPFTPDSLARKVREVLGKVD
ncbi:MAG TPA: ATP-binding protein [Candidatus Obscuribacterales bacterium]